MADNTPPAETSSELGWLGSVVDELKAPTVEALGWRIKSELGMYDNNQPGPVQTPVNSQATATASPAESNDVMIGGLAFNKWALAVAGVALTVAGVLWLPRLLGK